MENPPSPEQSSGAPEPEVLKPRSDDGAPAIKDAPAITTPASSEEGKRKRSRTYRPSHKATFIALGVVVVILAVNAVVFGFVLKNKSKNPSATGQVTISADVLNKIGVNTNSIGNSGIELVVDPNAKFNGKVLIAGDLNISGQFKLNNKLVASEAGLTKLEAGSASLSQLDVNGNSTMTSLILRNGLTVTGATQLQGAVTISQLLTANNNVNVLGNLSVGGIFTAATFSANSLTSTSTLTIGGHIISAGSAPNVGPGGGALGSNGTVSINGNDTAGRIGINIGVGSSPGTLVNVAFKTQYNTAPRVIISAVNVPSSITCGFYIANLTVAGFSVVDSCSLPIGGFAIDYIAFQ